MNFKKITPNLVVADLDKSLKFYRDILGFSTSQTVPDKAPFIFAWMKRGDAELFLNVNMPPQPGEPDLYAGKSIGGGTLSLYLVMEGIDDLYAKVQQQNVPIVIAMHKQFYGMREFAIHDPDGYLLIFAQEEGKLLAITHQGLGRLARRARCFRSLQGLRLDNSSQAVRSEATR